MGNKSISMIKDTLYKHDATLDTALWIHDVLLGGNGCFVQASIVNIHYKVVHETGSYFIENSELDKWGVYEIKNN